MLACYCFRLRFFLTSLYRFISVFKKCVKFCAFPQWNCEISDVYKPVTSYKNIKWSAHRERFPLNTRNLNYKSIPELNFNISGSNKDTDIWKINKQLFKAKCDSIPWSKVCAM